MYLKGSQRSTFPFAVLKKPLTVLRASLGVEEMLRFACRRCAVHFPAVIFNPIPLNTTVSIIPCSWRAQACIMCQLALANTGCCSLYYKHIVFRDAYNMQLLHLF